MAGEGRRHGSDDRREDRQDDQVVHPMEEELHLGQDGKPGPHQARELPEEGLGVAVRPAAPPSQEAVEVRRDLLRRPVARIGDDHLALEEGRVAEVDVLGQDVAQRMGPEQVALHQRGGAGEEDAEPQPSEGQVEPLAADVLLQRQN